MLKRAHISMHSLPSVTLIIVDCVDYKRAKKAFFHCLTQFNFGSAKFLTDTDDPDNEHIVKIPKISNKRDYSKFIILELDKYFDTPHVLLIQYDGFILNPSLWSSSFLEYDYIGAPWPRKLLYPNMPENFNVGNGGFSLRSKRLCTLLSKATGDTHPEDVIICQYLRPKLETLGIKFAPLEVAAKFSIKNRIEGLDQTRTFGQHGRNILSITETRNDPVCYHVNTYALGDALAAAPVVKWAIDTYHTESDYKVTVSERYKDFFSFVPTDNLMFIEQGQIKFEKGYVVRRLNNLSTDRPKLTPSKMSLSDYAAISLLSSLLKENEYEYLKLEAADISKFEGIDFSVGILIISHYGNPNRCMPPEEIIKLAKMLENRGLLPIFIGHKGFVEIPEGLGVDLREKTSLRELTTIMSRAMAVVGVDNGLLHLAGTTNVTIVGGYTNVWSGHRIPKRSKGLTLTLDSSTTCASCSSFWMKDTHNFGICYYGTNACSNTMTAERFFKTLSHLENFNEIYICSTK